MAWLAVTHWTAIVAGAVAGVAVAGAVWMRWYTRTITIAAESVEPPDTDSVIAALYDADVRTWDAQLRAGKREAATAHVEPPRDEAFDGLALIARKEWFAIQHADPQERPRRLAAWEETYAPLFRDARRRGLMQ